MAWFTDFGDKVVLITSDSMVRGVGSALNSIASVVEERPDGAS